MGEGEVGAEAGEDREEGVEERESSCVLGCGGVGYRGFGCGYRV